MSSWQKPEGSKVWHQFIETSSGKGQVANLSVCGRFSIQGKLAENNKPGRKRCERCA